MIRSEPIAHIIRFYKEETDDPFADYNAVCTIVWENNTEVWVKALNGNFTRKQLDELVLWLNSQGVEKAKATRAHGKKLPYSEDKGTYQEFIIKDIVARIKKRECSIKAITADS